jgi:hypothetical protein
MNKYSSDTSGFWQLLLIGGFISTTVSAICSLTDTYILRLPSPLYFIEMSITWLDICLGALSLFLVQRILVKKPLGRLPPGPKKWPLLGNMLDMPTSKEWLTFAEWGWTYGNCLTWLWGGWMSNSSQGIFRPWPCSVARWSFSTPSNIAVDMLDKKSSKYSDRPAMPMGGELGTTLYVIHCSKLH